MPLSACSSHLVSIHCCNLQNLERLDYQGAFSVAKSAVNGLPYGQLASFESGYTCMFVTFKVLSIHKQLEMNQISIPDPLHLKTTVRSGG